MYTSIWGMGPIMHLILLRYMWNKNNLSLVKINKITPELHLIQDLRHQFLSQDIQQTKDIFSKHTLWDKRGVTGGRHSFCLSVFIQDAQIEKYPGFSARNTPGNVTLWKKRILSHETPWSSLRHVHQSRSSGPYLRTDSVALGVITDNLKMPG